jgi:hypothetical protein
MFNKSKIAIAFMSAILALGTVGAANAGTWKANHPYRTAHIMHTHHQHFRAAAGAAQPAGKAP